MNSNIILGLLFAFAAVVEPGPEQIFVKDLSEYLPDTCLIKDWEPLHPPQTFVGDNLYDFINGGASIYYEYGFKQVITLQYVNPDSQYMTLELYEMKNSAAAFGMYIYKAGTSGKSIDIGADALLDDYYLNFWKGRFLCTITGSEFDVEALLMIAREVAKKITDTSPRPRLIDLLPADSLQHMNSGYVRGKLGLTRYHRFDDVDILDVKEAGIGNYDDYQIFIFKYDDTKQCFDVFQNVQGHIRNNPEHSDFAAFEGAFSVRDGSERLMHFTVFEQYMLAYIGTPEHDPAVFFEIIRNNIK
ncbi:MAG: hypothetical protein JSW02_04485 [candidate division WOR-3 bacterium]|nr:MAG: hypothetical protein JSW02_04485 [candidate division WOR-3 bacterium]